jgi:hypothetical protein
MDGMPWERSESLIEGCFFVLGPPPGVGIGEAAIGWKLHDYYRNSAWSVKQYLAQSYFTYLAFLRPSHPSPCVSMKAVTWSVDGTPKASGYISA